MYATDLPALTMAQVHEEAGALQKAYAAGDPAVREQMDKREKVQGGSPTERQALRVVSRTYGFHNWTKFRSYLELDNGVREAIEAVRFGDLERLQEVLRVQPESANPFWPERDEPHNPIPNDSIPLFMVCIGLSEKTNTKGNAGDLVKALLAAGANPDIEDSMPLNSAASFNLVEIAEALLEGGAKVDGASDDGNPLAHALFFGWDVAKLLEARSAKLDLRMAAGLGRIDVMASFFKADGTLIPEASALHLMWSKAFDFPDAEVLAQALVNACITNQVEAAAFLLDRGADINAMPKGFDFRATGLHRAIRRGNTEVARLLIERGADLTLKDGRHHWDVLTWAKEMSRDQIVNLIRV